MKNIFGNKKDIKTYAIVGIVLGTVITFTSRCTKIPEPKVWDIVDEVQRKVKPGTIINDFVIKDPEKLQRRIDRDVNRAIRDYDLNETVVITKPKYSESLNDDSVCYTKECKALSPPMRLCAPYVDGCESVTEGLTNW